VNDDVNHLDVQHTTTSHENFTHSLTKKSIMNKPVDTIIGSVPILSQSQACRSKDSARLNQLGINLMSKFSCVAQNSQTHLITNHTTFKMKSSVTPLVDSGMQPVSSTAFTPQANDDFCSSEDESDLDYNPFEYPGQ
jgi:hypothetical protein